MSRDFDNEQAQIKTVEGEAQKDNKTEKLKAELTSRTDLFESETDKMEKVFSDAESELKDPINLGKLQKEKDLIRGFLMRVVEFGLSAGMDLGHRLKGAGWTPDKAGEKDKTSRDLKNKPSQQNESQTNRHESREVKHGAEQEAVKSDKSGEQGHVRGEKVDRGMGHIENNDSFEKTAYKAQLSSVLPMANSINDKIVSTQTYDSSYRLIFAATQETLDSNLFYFRLRDQYNLRKNKSPHQDFSEARISILFDGKVVTSTVVKFEKNRVDTQLRIPKEFMKIGRTFDFKCEVITHDSGDKSRSENHMNEKDSSERNERDLLIDAMRSGDISRIEGVVERIITNSDSINSGASLDRIHAEIAKLNSAKSLLSDLRSNHEIDILKQKIIAQKHRLIMRLGSVDIQRSWDILLLEHPELAKLNVNEGTINENNVLTHTAGFFSIGGGFEKPSVTIMPGNREHFIQLMQTRKQSVKMASESLGISVEQMTPEILRTFIFLHEIGHAEEAIRLDENRETHSKRRTNEMLRLPIKEVNPAALRIAIENGSLNFDSVKDPAIRVLAENAKRGDHISIERLMELQETAYHRLPSEAYADSFAAKFMRTHAKELGLEEVFSRTAVAPPKGVLDGVIERFYGTLPEKFNEIDRDLRRTYIDHTGIKGFKLRIDELQKFNNNKREDLKLHEANWNTEVTTKSPMFSELTRPQLKTYLESKLGVANWITMSSDLNFVMNDKSYAVGLTLQTNAFESFGKEFYEKTNIKLTEVLIPILSRVIEKYRSMVSKLDPDNTSVYHFRINDAVNFSSSFAGGNITMGAVFIDSLARSILNNDYNGFKVAEKAIESQLFHEFIHGFNAANDKQTREALTMLGEFLYDPLSNDHSNKIFEKDLADGIINEEGLNAEGKLTIYDKDYKKVTSKILFHELFLRGLIDSPISKDNEHLTLRHMSEFYAQIPEQERFAIINKYLRYEVDELEQFGDSVTRELGLSY